MLLTNTILLDWILTERQRKHASVYMIILDVSKAFDSVSHPVIFSTFEDYDFPDDFIDYLRTMTPRRC